MTQNHHRPARFDFGLALSAVVRGYFKAADRAVDDLPGGPRGYQVLSAAARGEAPSQIALAQQLGVDRTVMTYLLDDLERAGFVERRPDPADRRSRQIVITAPGQQELCRLERKLHTVEDTVLTPLTPAERETLRDMLSRLAAYAGDVPHACQLAEHTRTTEPPGPTSSC
ncbi:MarR family winged helix-turn-helix transcriptional regulator [Crossiella sp. SN42]|uniref:MarR family winged helix-turn-helix transcriptional regulator n=1 Tax=Crossiella sp. SN42 TaxID=2944808 RepID=UPI00207D159E|nr:MarR family winged helix-turn-helix transcriptional regulator [Crossiella sp. SN42]MCO1579167.1 MarR family winged helix-turn-helix transcriptional regulator [Crossiella sp. SN42]